MPYWGRMAGFGSAPQQPTTIVPPTPPPIAASFGLTNRTFYDPFNSLSTIDTGNTGAPGFNWYVQCNFQNNATAPSNVAAGATSFSLSSIPVNPNTLTPVGAGWQIVDYGPVSGGVALGSTGAFVNPTYITSVTGSGPFTFNLSRPIAGPGIVTNDLLIFYFPPADVTKMSIVTQAGVTCLKMTNVGQTISNYALGTCIFTSLLNPANQTIGFTTGLNKSWYFRMMVAFDETISNTTSFTSPGSRWPALSAYSDLNNNGTLNIEIDCLDCIPSVGDVALSYYIHGTGAHFSDQTSYTNQGRGQVATLGTITSGSGYVNGVYQNVPLYDVNAPNNGVTGLTATVTVTGGAITSVVVVTPGLRANSSETVTTPNTNLGGSGSGFQVPITSVSNLTFLATQWHTWECAYITTGDNGGVGLYNFYIDGMLVGTGSSFQGSVEVTLTGAANPATNNPYTGEFTAPQFAPGSGFDFVIANPQLAGGGDYPMYIGPFEVWQKP